MNMNAIRKIARGVGIKPAKLNKKALIRTIQTEEGNYDCFASGIEESACDQSKCLWRSDCFATAKKSKAA